jgi:3-isopropylmalate/(R)-2-methylmalate dehydratase small subunit
MKSFSGSVLFLDRSDINTDEIIPAKYLTEITKEALKPYLLEDLKLDGFNPNSDIKGKKVVITRSNFGCGSSREHAPWALEVNDINAVFAVNFARIFRQNMYNCGMLATELSEANIDEMFDTFSGKDTEAIVDIEKATLTLKAENIQKEYAFKLEGFDRALIEAEGWVGYADANY